MDVVVVVIRLLDDEEAWTGSNVQWIEDVLRSRQHPQTPAAAHAAKAFLDAMSCSSSNEESKYDKWVREWVDARYETYVRPRRRAVLAAVLSHRRPLHIIQLLYKQ